MITAVTAALAVATAGCGSSKTVTTTVTTTSTPATPTYAWSYPDAFVQGFMGVCSGKDSTKFCQCALTYMENTSPLPQDSVAQGALVVSTIKYASQNCEY